MDWGSGVTSLGATALKDRQVIFGIKDQDRLRHLCVLGRVDSGRAEFIARMAFQDIDRGMGVVVLDAKGNLAPYLLERFGKEMEDRLVYLEPAEAEYPYSWNPLDDIRGLSKQKQERALADLLTSVYQLESDALTVLAAPALLRKKESTLVTFYALIFDEKVRKEYFDDTDRALFESALNEHTETVDTIHEQGRYIAKDTLVRNLLGQSDSTFSLSEVSKGKVIVVNMEKIRMFPTRMTPLVRTFVFASRVAGTVDMPTSVYLHDTLRHLGSNEIERSFNGKEVTLTVSDTVIQEADREKREQALARCGSILSFAAHPLDRPLIERAFYPYVDPEELEHLESGEFALALTVDGVRTQPFFGTALPVERQRTSSYQDLAATSRSRYTTSRTKVDELFKSDDRPRGKRKPPGFQDAFKAMFDKRAKAGQVGASVGTPPPKVDEKLKTEEKKPEKKEDQKKENSSQSEERKEVPESTLKQMLYVPSVS